MNAPLLVEILVGFGIGLSLGLLGGGGSILTVPALVYLVGQSPQAAVTTSLAIVGANSVVGASIHRQHGTLNWRVALLFGGAGMLMAYLVSGVSKQISPLVLLIVFAVLMLVVGAMMLRGMGNLHVAEKPHWLLVLGAGVGVGAMTGFLGVGGGFLIVPALVMLIGLPMTQAVGTSLLVIALNSFAGLLGHLTGAALDWNLIAVFVIAGMVGTFVGARWGRRLPAAQLRQMFGVFVIVLGIFLLVDNSMKLMRG